MAHNDLHQCIGAFLIVLLVRVYIIGRCHDMRRFCALLICLFCLCLASVSPAMAQDSLAETSFWETVRDSGDPAELEAYLKTYPDGQFAPLAWIRLNKLQGAVADPVHADEIVASEAPFVHECDWLAAQPLDPDKTADGVDMNWIDPDKAIQACEAAVATYPDLPRFRYQLARALDKAGSGSAAIDQFRQAARDGHAFSMLRLGLIHLWGEGIPKDQVAALKWFGDAADSNLPYAMNFLGTMYQNGQGVDKDLAEAVEWYRKAAKLGEPQAMYNLGIAYLNGQGVAQDEAQAIEWLRKATEQQYAPAMIRLGALYEQGRGTQKDIRKALNLFFEAAETGNPTAYFYLARAHHYGIGVDRDYRAAAEYMFRSLQRGYDFAINQMTANAGQWNIGFRRDLQRIMQEEGFYTGAIDGAFGPGTRRAIEALSTSLDIQIDDYPNRDTGGERMRVNIPELNVFPRPSVRTDRLGALFMGDIVTVLQRQNDSQGDSWASICTSRYCGWIATEFLQVAPAQTSVEIPDTVKPTILPTKQLPETVEPKEPQTEQPPEPEGLGTLD